MMWSCQDKTEKKLIPTPPPPLCWECFDVPLLSADMLEYLETMYSFCSSDGFDFSMVPDATVSMLLYIEV